MISVIPTSLQAWREPSGSFCAVGDHLAMSSWEVITNKAVGDGRSVGDGRGCSWAMGVLEKRTSGRFDKLEFRFHTIVGLY